MRKRRCRCSSIDHCNMQWGCQSAIEENRDSFWTSLPRSAAQKRTNYEISTGGKDPVLADSPQLTSLDCRRLTTRHMRTQAPILAVIFAIQLHAQGYPPPGPALRCRWPQTAPLL